ncbi:VOC family protein [Kocuria turfanensis]|uniref:VOC family protein n=1 Tax=Kocuria turfanensis TaxID=388357 RepID=UPI00403680CB
MIDHLDHLVLTVEDMDKTIDFYQRALGLRVQETQGRTALLGNGWKINLHPTGNSIEPKAARPTPGSADLCFITTWPIPRVLTHLADLDIDVELGPVPRNGALGLMTSIYVRDPDRNLVEISQYPSVLRGA